MKYFFITLAILASVPSFTLAATVNQLTYSCDVTQNGKTVIVNLVAKRLTNVYLPSNPTVLFAGGAQVSPHLWMAMERTENPTQSGMKVDLDLYLMTDTQSFRTALQNLKREDKISAGFAELSAQMKCRFLSDI